MSKFKRDHGRYTVLKSSDLRPEELENLADFIEDKGLRTRECVVIESHWPIYEEAWDLVERLENDRAGADGWRPISEAEEYKKDGRALLLYSEDLVNLDFNPEGVVEGAWLTDAGGDGVDGWVGAVWDGCHDLWSSVPVQPTHFQLKPRPPAGEIE